MQDRIAERFDFLRERGRFAHYPEGVHVSSLARDSLNGVRPFDPSRIESWRTHLPRVKAQLTAYPELATALVRLGYETDSRWTEALEGVEPFEQSYKEREPNWLKRTETALRYWLKTRRYLKQRAG